MKAVWLTAPGGIEHLQITQVPKPELSHPEQIRVRLYAAGINPVDYKMRQKGGFFPDRLPIILGCDGAGVVEALGEEVTRFKVGDEVYFFNGGIGTQESGNYAEYTTIHQDYAALKPKNLSFVEAAAVPLAWITAWESLIDRVQLQSHQTVLIHAAAGGVGHLAMQLAKKLGARVAVTVSGKEKTEFVKSLGAELCIDYRTTDFVQATLEWTQGKGAEVVFDTIGGEITCRSIAATRVYGKLVTILDLGCDDNAFKLARLRNLHLIQELMLTPQYLNMHEARVAQRNMLEKASDMFETGHLKIQVSHVFPLSEVAHAHELIEGGHTFGKMVLQIVE